MYIESVIQFREYLRDQLLNDIGFYSCAINSEKIIRCSEDEEFRKIVQNSKLPVPDGAGALLFFRKKKLKAFKIDLPKTILEIGNEIRSKICIVGSTQKNIELATNNIQKLYGNINIVSAINGYHSDQKIIDTIRECKPQIVFLGLGSPKQEKLSYQLNKIFPSVKFINCGGAIDILAGAKKRAPVFIQNSNFEWLYRLIKEPKRFKRYLRLFMIFKLLLDDK